MNTTLYFPDQGILKKIELKTDAPESIATLNEIAKLISRDYFLLKIKPGEVKFETDMVLKWMYEVSNTGELFSYCNYEQISDENTNSISTIEYTEGSIRDDFNFGALVVVNTSTLNDFLKWNVENFEFAGWYSFRLFASREKGLHHNNKTCYQYSEMDLRKSGEKQFDYVNPRNLARQQEMEKAATIHLKAIGALVSPPFRKVNFSDTTFKAEASVIIPVLNRAKTIADAIQSVLKQKTNFLFNLIVVDNHSTDQTSAIVEGFNDERIVHLIPQATNLGIGGCWNEGINHRDCGRFAVQLDSDDLYLNEHTLQKIVDKFREDKCAMVIGSYQMVNFKLEQIPPGVIDHREWTNSNGPNNALRINGLGAPRAFYTPVIREIGFPNVSYGEDYAVALAISRTWKIGRIYDPIYLCRRWDDNTDANLNIEKMNVHNAYKDSLRTTEIIERKKSVHNGH